MAILNGKILVANPAEVELKEDNVSWDEESKESKSDLMRKLIKLITHKDDGKISCIGRLPYPLDDCTAFIDYDQADPETKYNFVFFGTPLFNSVVFMGIDLTIEDMPIIPLDDNRLARVKSYIEFFKEAEQKEKVYENISSTDKTAFLEEYYKEQAEALKEEFEKTKENKEEDKE